MRKVRLVRGKPTVRFERIPGRRAEALDAVTYSFAAKAVTNVNFDLREDDLRRPLDAPVPAPRPTVVQSEWMRRQMDYRCER